MAAFCVDNRNYLDFMIKWAVFITNITLMHFQKETKNQLMIAIKSRISYRNNKPIVKLVFKRLDFLFVHGMGF